MLTGQIHSGGSIDTGPAAGGRVFARGLRYEDLVTRDNERWSIIERRH